MHQREGAFIFRIHQVLIEPAQLTDQKHSFIYDRPGGHGTDVSILRALLKRAAGCIQPPVKIDPGCGGRGTADKTLHHAGHAVDRCFSEDLRMDRHLPPPEQL